jgi:hypothetical protein
MGRVLAWSVRDDGRSQLMLVDTASGARTDVIARDGEVEGLLSPDGNTAYWAEMLDDRVDGVFRCPVDACVPERVVGGWPGHVYSMDWSTDGARMVLAGLPAAYDEVRYEYRVLSVSDETGMLGPVGITGGRVVGLDADNLIVYAIDDQGHERLVSTDIISGSVLPLGDQPNERAFLVGADTGPVLVVDGPSDGRYALYRMSLDGTERQLLWASDEPWDDHSIAMVRPTRSGSVEAPGWVLVAPGGRAYPVDDAERARTRALVSVADGTVTALPPPPDLRKADASPAG